MRQPLCPGPTFWRLSLISLNKEGIILHLEPRRCRVNCPACGTRSTRVHSHYRRQAWDLPWSRWPVQVNIQARRFFCDNPICHRRIFAEPFPRVLARHARRTGRAQALLLELAHASSAERAAHVARLLGFPISPDTLIRWQRQERFAFPAPLALGHRLKERFPQIVREGYVGGLEPWLHAAQASGLPTCQSVARGLRRDYKAVRMALVLPWSTAQCEGQICRLKLTKRIGYGRAKPDLLRQRVLHRPVVAG